MSAPRTSRCIFCVFSRTTRPPLLLPKRGYHTSPTRLNRKPKHDSIKAEKVRSVNVVSQRPWTEAEMNQASERYSPEQLAAIKAAQSIINPKQLNKNTINTDPWRLDYYDDFTKIDPVVDKPVRQPYSNTDASSRLKTINELEDDLAQFVADFPTDGKEQDVAWTNFEKNLRMTVGREESERHPRTAEAPDLAIAYKEESEPQKKKSHNPSSDQPEEEEASPALVRLMQMTGYNRRQISAFRVKSIVTHRVVNQTRLGKIQKIYYLSVAGNGQGLIGIGEGKSEEPAEARLQSQYRAIRNMQPVLRYEGRTIFGDVKGKVSATELELYARPPGFGLRCQQYIYEICKCAGISDLAARVTRSRNPMNTVKATVQALLSQKDPEDIARARGKKLVDVRKVYYAGLV